MKGFQMTGKANAVGAALDELTERFKGWTVEQYADYLYIKETVEKQLAEVVK